MLDNRFQLDRLLKSGQGIQTWRGTDLLEESEVVIKMTKDFSGAIWLRLHHEAEVLSRLGHQGLRGVGRTETGLYVAAEYVPGPTLEERLADGHAMPLDESVKLAADLLLPLQELHEAGILHRDVKPSNVVLSPSGPVLIDFGLARSARLQSWVAELPVGSLLYLAPEMSGTLGRDVGPATDLYAVGATLYHAVTGHPPFVGATASELLRAHLCSPVPAHRNLPPTLQAILDRLLAKDPQARYQSAGAARHDLLAMKHGRVVVGLQDDRGTLADPALVGRDSILAELEAELSRGGLVTLEAQSGGGKSRLLDELARRATAVGVRVFRGQATAQEASFPWQLLARPAFEAAADQELCLHLRRELDQWGPTVVSLLPQLKEALGLEPFDQGPELHGWRRALSALSTWLTALGSSTRPALVLLDDGQWADPESLELLDDWAADHPAGCSTLVVLALRSEEMDSARLRAKRRYSLAPLTPAQSQAVLESMLGNCPTELLNWVQEVSQGLPLFLVETSRGLVEQGALKRDGAGWAFCSDEAQLSRRAAAWLTRRLEALPLPTLELLSCAAVLGKTFSLDLLHAISPGPVWDHLQVARRERLLWGDASGTSFTFSHDRIRGALFERLDPERRLRLHVQIADHLELEHSAPSFLLAYHLDSAGLAERARGYAMQAAAQARARYEMSLAESCYRIALRGQPDCFDTLCRLAEVIELRDRYDESEEYRRKALDLAPDGVTRARLLSVLGDLELRRGNYLKAEQLYLQSLSDLGVRMPGNQVEAALRLLTWIATRALGQRTDPLSESDLISMASLRGVVFITAHRGAFLNVMHAHALAMTLARREPETRESLVVLTEHIAFLFLLSALDGSAAFKHFASIEGPLRRLQDPWLLGKAISRTLPLDFGARPLSATRGRIDECRALLERSGDLLEWGMATWILAQVLYHSGRLRESAELSQQMLFRAQKAGASEVAIMALETLACSCGGRIELPKSIEVPANEHSMARVHLGTARAYVALASNRPTEAVELLQALIGKGFPPNLAQLWCWLATSWRKVAEQLPVHSHSQRRRCYHQARRASRQAVFYCRAFNPSWLCHALREAALAAAEKGHHFRAEALFLESLEHARKVEFGYESAWTRLERARVRLATGRESAELELDQALQELVALGATWFLPEEEPSTPALLDRFSESLAWGRRLASQPDTESLPELLTQAATALIRSQHCLVLEAPDWKAQFLPPQPLSQTLIARAVESGRPVVADQETSTDSLLLTGIRSALCAPYHVRGRVAGCLYLTHQDLGGLFTREEERLAEYLTTLAGAALEHDIQVREKLAAMSALATSQERFQNLFQSVRVGMALVDTQDRVLECNPHLGEMLAVPGVDLIGRCLKDYLYAGDASRDEALFQEVRLDRRAWHRSEVRYNRGPGLRWGEWTLYRVSTPDGPLLLRSLSDETSERVEQLAQFQEDERRFLAGELHDVSQPLVGISLATQRLNLMLRGERYAEAANQGEETARDIQNLLQDLSSLMYSLRSPIVEGFSLQEALSDFLNSQRTRDLEVRLHIGSALPRVGGLVGAFAFRICQEALANVRKHATASEVRITLERQGANLVGRIVDDGRGFTRASQPTFEPGHFGLRGMQLRAELLRGQLRVDSKLGEGTQVSFEVPYDFPE